MILSLRGVRVSRLDSPQRISESIAARLFASHDFHPNAREVLLLSNDLLGVLAGATGEGFYAKPTYSARCWPVRVERAATKSAGVPSNTTRPPSWPAPGPRSMIQSAWAMTAW